MWHNIHPDDMWALKNFVLPVLTSLFATLLVDRLITGPRQLRWAIRAPLILTIFALGMFIARSVETSLPASTERGNGGTTEPKDDASGISPETIFWNKFVDPKGNNGGPANQWPVVLVEDGRPAGNDLNGAILEALEARGHKTSAIFRSAIFTSDGFNQLNAADSTILRKLRTVCDGVIVGAVKEHVSGPDGYEIYTSELSAEIRIFSTRSEGAIDEFSLSSRGGGFSKDAARKQAGERLSKELKRRVAQHLP